MADRYDTRGLIEKLQGRLPPGATIDDGGRIVWADTGEPVQSNPNKLMSALEFMGLLLPGVGGVSSKAAALAAAQKAAPAAVDATSLYKAIPIAEASGDMAAPVRAIKNTKYRTPGEIDAVDEAAMSGEGGYEGPTRAERLARQEAAKAAEQARLDAMATEGPISMNRVRSGLPAVQGGRNLAQTTDAGLPAIPQTAQTGMTKFAPQNMDVALAQKIIQEQNGNQLMRGPRTVGGEGAENASGPWYRPGGSNAAQPRPGPSLPTAAATIGTAAALPSLSGSPDSGQQPDIPWTKDAIDAAQNPVHQDPHEQAIIAALTAAQQQQGPPQPSAQPDQSQRYPGMADIAARIAASQPDRVQEQRFRPSAAPDDIAVAPRPSPTPVQRQESRPAPVRHEAAPDYQSARGAVIQGNKINWGDSDSPADFVRASQALQDNPGYSGLARGGAATHDDVAYALQVLHRALMRR